MNPNSHIVECNGCGTQIGTQVAAGAGESGARLAASAHGWKVIEEAATHRRADLCPKCYEERIMGPIRSGQAPADMPRVVGLDELKARRVVDASLAASNMAVGEPVKRVLDQIYAPEPGGGAAAAAGQGPPVLPGPGPTSPLGGPARGRLTTGSDEPAAGGR